MRLLLLLVLFVCFVAYARTQQPQTWNSWMVALGANSLVTSANPADSDASSAQVAPVAPAAHARVVPVGGLIRNGNFVAGEGCWQGDGIADPSGKGLVISLNPASWTRVYQTFPDQGTQHSIEITYKLSPGLATSQNPADYADISDRVQLAGYEHFRSMAISPGQFYGTVGDPNNMISEEVYSPRYGTTDVQDYRHDYPPIPASASKIFALAFPPGTGTVTLLTAYVTSH